MRLTAAQIAALKRAAAQVFGPQARLLLFGSRVDDARRGGDIDLYVRDAAQQSADDRLDAKLRFLAKAKRELGERRIDVVFAPLSPEQRSSIDGMAEETGVLL